MSSEDDSRPGEPPLSEDVAAPEAETSSLDTATAPGDSADVPATGAPENASETGASETESTAAPFGESAVVPPPIAAIDPGGPPPSVVATLLTGFLSGTFILGLIDVTAFFRLRRVESLGTVFLRVVYDIGLTMACGALFATLLAVVEWALVRRLPRARGLVIAVLYVALTTFAAQQILGRTLTRQADVLLQGKFSAWLYPAMIFGAGIGLAFAHRLGTWFSRRFYLEIFAGLASLAAGVVNQLFYKDDYFETHSVVVWASAVVFGSALGPRIGRTLAKRPRVERGVAVVLLAWCAVAALWSPPNDVRLALFRTPGATGAWAFAILSWELPALPITAPSPTPDAWIAPRGDLPSIPPTSPRLIAQNPVVVFLTVDATRADVIADRANDDRLPTFARMRREGAHFEWARSPGSQTAVSLTAVFSGRYFSQLRWSKFGKANSRFDYAAADETPRFPRLLTEAGVSTTKFGSVLFLGNAFGVAGGFQEETMAVDDRRHARAEEIVEPLLRRLRKIGPGPAFFYGHLMEPHAPYDRGGSKGEPFDNYIAELAIADRQLGRVLRTLEEDALKDRAMLIVSADHGEAFGEHGTFEHTKTIYDELLRVPLLVFGKGVKARAIDEPVTLVDLGPTILDVFGAPTPAGFMGQSLVPVLAGGEPAFERPIFAEGRLRRALVQGDIKVIVDLRRKVVEAFDLARDPEELHNLFGEEDPRVASALATLTRFFDANTYAKDGYRPIYKP